MYVGAGKPQRPYELRHRTPRWKDVMDGKPVEVKILGWFETKAQALSFEFQKIEEINPPANIVNAPHQNANPGSRKSRLMAVGKWGGARMGAGRKAKNRCDCSLFTLEQVAENGHVCPKPSGTPQICMKCLFQWHSKIENPKACPACGYRRKL